MPLGVLALGGGGGLVGEWGVRGGGWVRRRKEGSHQPAAGNCLQPVGKSGILVLWPTLYFLYIGTWGARFVRHLVPLVPFLCLFAVFALVKVWESGIRGRWVARLVGGVVLAGTTVWALSFIAVHGTADTRWQA